MNKENIYENVIINEYVMQPEDMIQQLESAKEILEKYDVQAQIAYLLPCQIKMLRDKGLTAMSADGHDEYVLGIKIKEWPVLE